jgi:predicted transposase YbfD/YdcC
MVSAFAARQRLLLGQVEVAEKSNAIAAIPQLLDMLSIEGAIVTIDAIGCQREIAQKIIDKKGGYVLALKGNQGSLHDGVQLLVAGQKANDFADRTTSRSETVDAGHGRIGRPHRVRQDHYRQRWLAEFGQCDINRHKMAASRSA